jgi:hypothetical protein
MITFDELNIPYLPSGRLWRGFAPPTSFAPTGSATISQSGNPAFGFYDNFHSFHTTSGEGPYRIVTGTGCSVLQIADTATDKGLIQLAIDGNAANDEAILQWGRGLGAPFQFANNDLVFETRLSVSSITTALHSWAVGLAVVGAGATDGLLDDVTASNAIIANTSFLGFAKLANASSGVSGCYRASGQAVQNGSTNTRLLNLATLTVNGFVKLGFRYRASPQTVEWFVNGSLAGTSSAPARLTTSQISNVLFPSTTLMTPVIAIKDVAGSSSALNMRVDWMACAQNL